VTSPLSTTSYAVLGLLSLRSWTGYELVQQMQRSLVHAWPKEDSVLYEEPRRLVARGLATAHKERDGRRVRNRYEITDEGRRALRAWLAEPSNPPRFEAEPMLRLIFADQGEVSDALAAVNALRDWAATRFASGAKYIHAYRAGDVRFPEREHINALFARMYAELYLTVLSFADLAEKEIRDWPRTYDLDRRERTRELMNELFELADRAPAENDGE
jgi:DNA-binding PadR family transcriptional regulator